MRRSLLCLLVTFSACTAPDVGHSRAPILTASSTLEDTATIYENEMDHNGGSYADICIGVQNSATSIRRAYVRYTTPVVPSGSTVTRVVWTVTQLRVRASFGGALPATLSVREATSGWTEGAGMGSGAPCGFGADVPGVDWASAPSLDTTESASEAMDAVNGSIITIDTDVGTDDDELIADFQGWIDGGPNHGWMFQVIEESTINNTRVLAPGALTVYYTAPAGGTCSVDDDCASGHCVGDDGEDCETGTGAGCVCCDQDTCNGVCETCHRSGSMGTCTPRASDTECGIASCTAGVATLAQRCDGFAGDCPTPTTVVCAPDMCNGDACESMCATGADCTTGFCVDGVCCDATCDGQCEACDVAGSVGTCSPVTGAPHGDREACASDGSRCGGLCDGSEPTSCVYPDETTECRSASCMDGTAIQVASCASDGTCPAEVMLECALERCRGPVCESPDGSVGDGGPDTMGDGCSCRAGQRDDGSPVALLALLAIALIGRRRK